MKMFSIASFRVTGHWLLLLSLLTPSLQAQQATVADDTQRAANLPSGINDNFLSPELDPEEFIKRFEVESREVFACREQILASIQLSKGMSVADVGAGTGLYMKALSKSVGESGHVYSVDISPNFVKHLRKRATDEGLDNVEVVFCNDRNSNLKPGSVDRVFICDTYHHFEYPASTLASIHAALRPGGKLILVDFTNKGEGDRGQWLNNHIRAPKEVFQQEIEDAGFDLEEEVNVEGFKENYLLRFTKK
ncbi:MAG: class I SAM-dependent methyltransferase [Planctomycetales bacterium]|nr:class I SAM-dependent methyltransferase [Planctomycetales bacterium]